MTANDIQIAGKHYKTGYQPWDFMHDMELGYFEGNIVKYTQRHRTKAGAADLDKAAHYAQKWIELFEEGRKFQNILAKLCNPHITPSQDYWKGTEKVKTAVERFTLINALGPLEYSAISRVVYASDVRDGYAVLDLLRELRRAAYPNG